MDEAMAVQIGSGLRAARLRAGLTAEQVADAVRLLPPVYIRLERGKLLPTVPTLHALCLALRVRSDWLWLGNPTRG